MSDQEQNIEELDQRLSEMLTDELSDIQVSEALIQKTLKAIEAEKQQNNTKKKITDNIFTGRKFRIVMTAMAAVLVIGIGIWGFANLKMNLKSSSNQTLESIKEATGGNGFAAEDMSYEEAESSVYSKPNAEDSIFDFQSGVKNEASAMPQETSRPDGEYLENSEIAVPGEMIEMPVVSETESSEESSISDGLQNSDCNAEEVMKGESDANLADGAIDFSSLQECAESLYSKTQSLSSVSLDLENVSAEYILQYSMITADKVLLTFRVYAGDDSIYVWTDENIENGYVLTDADLAKKIREAIAAERK